MQESHGGSEAGSETLSSDFFFLWSFWANALPLSYTQAQLCIFERSNSSEEDWAGAEAHQKEDPSSLPNGKRGRAVDGRGGPWDSCEGRNARTR